MTLAASADGRADDAGLCCAGRAGTLSASGEGLRADRGGAWAAKDGRLPNQHVALAVGARPRRPAACRLPCHEQACSRCRRCALAAHGFDSLASRPGLTCKLALTSP
eukprot:scaffold533_cov369-Prasinococcus_capsulatus_cf.AAC.18